MGGYYTPRLFAGCVRALGAWRLVPAACAALAAPLAVGHASAIQPLHRFTYSNAVPSHYALGASPYGELLQASDGNFYGTTIVGGAGLCPNTGQGGYTGCGTVFRMTPAGKVTVLYSFPYSAKTSSAPNGAFPTAGLIQGKDGFLYGVAQDGGIGRCNGALGCGTLFRISLAGTFTRLHQFCSGDGCTNPGEGGRPMAHLVQTPAGLLCGTTQQGGIQNSGTVFCASTGGSVTTEYVFNPTIPTDGNSPVAALLVGADGKTLYGTTTFGGANGGGTVFASLGTAMTVLHAFDSNSGTAGTSFNPESALIFGKTGKLYGTTYSGGTGGVIFSLNSDGTGFSSSNVFTASVAGDGFESTSGLLLASNGVMYGTTYAGGTGGDDGAVYSYNPVTGTTKNPLVSFSTTTGAAPRAALIEGKDGYLYGTSTLYGDTNHDSGSAFRIAPALPTK